MGLCSPQAIESYLNGISTHLGGNLYKPEVEEEKYVATVNAELVAVGSAIMANQSIANTTIYTSDAPNWITFKLLVTIGIKRIVFYGPVTNERMTHYARELGIELVPVGG